MPKPSNKPKPRTTPSQGRADLARLRRMTDREIERTSAPELRDLPDDFWRDARVVTPVGKQALSLRLDADVIAWFRATGPRYQTRMNAVLRSYVEEMGRTGRARRAKKAG
jgi:uncharacterized protein (DUF4415 family)